MLCLSKTAEEEMVEPHVQLVAVVSQEEEKTDISDVRQLLEDSLKQRFAYQRKRFQTALLYSTLTTTGVIIAFIVVSVLNFFNLQRLPETYKLYETFYEWRTEGVRQPPVCNWLCE